MKSSNLSKQEPQVQQRVSVYVDTSILWQSAASSFSERLGYSRSDIRPDYKSIKTKITQEALRELVRMGEYLTLTEAKRDVEIDYTLFVTSQRPVKSGSGRGFIQRMQSLGWNTQVHHRPKGMARYDWAPTICCHAAASLIAPEPKPALVVIASGSSSYLPLEELLVRNGVPMLMMGYLESLCGSYTRSTHFDESTLMNLTRDGWGQI